MTIKTRDTVIEFRDVGREKFNAKIAFQTLVDLEPSANDIATLAYREARKHLISSSMETVYDADKNEGIIFAGFHAVGHFKVVS